MSYEFLTGKKFTSEQAKKERQEYYDYLKERYSGLSGYVDWLYGPF